MLLSAEQLTKSYGDRVLLDGVSFYLERGDKVGIIGVNGAGKSTLLRLLAGAEEPDGGTVRLDPGVRMEYLPQNPVFQGERTVLEQVLLGLNDADRSLAEYEARTILNRLGVSRFEQSVGNLSGGERRRVALAAVLARPCDVLILDEPTNHLDNDMVLWLEDYLRAWKGALVMVTHDRYFLERIVGRMAEVEDGRLFTHEGNYDKYLERKAARLESERASERKRQAILRREYQWVMQGPTARGTKSRERLERYEALKDVFTTIPEKQPIRRLSKGMQKQSAFWLALCCRPDILVLDEPVDGLDPVMRRQVWSLLMGDVADHGTTVLVSSHNLRELEDVCDHVGILSRGKVLIERSLSALQENVVKMQVVFQEKELPQLPGDLQVLHVSQVGRIHTLIIRGNATEITNRLAAFAPILMEALPLTLEEIFIYELGGEDYAVRDIVL